MEAADLSRNKASGGRYQYDSVDWRLRTSQLTTARPLIGFEEGVVAVFSPWRRQVGIQKVHSEASEGEHIRQA